LSTACPIASQPGAYIVWLGYNNLNPINTYIPVGPDNQFVPTPGDLYTAPFVASPTGQQSTSTTRVAANLNQPTKFTPGIVHYAFSITVSSSSQLSWVLTNTLSNQANTMINIATNYPTVCTGKEVASTSLVTTTTNSTNS